MQRIMCPERDDWQRTAEQCGFAFHTIDGERYWDERAFTLDEIERSIETPTGEIDAMCLELAGRVIGDERHLRRLKIPDAFWDLIAESWERDDRSLYGRLDLKFDGDGPAKLLEYNADTPTSIFEAAVFQWTWLEQAIERRIIPARRPVQLDPRAGGFVDLDDRDMALVFKLYPWEWMFHDAFGAKLAGAPTRWIEPPWKAVLSNKGILPLLWEMFPNHPNLLPAFFEDDPRAAELGSSYVRKPLLSREGANVRLVSGGMSLDEHAGPTAPKALCARRCHRYRTFQASIRWWGAGW